jgi:GT2 family glycosyltransferase
MKKPKLSIVILSYNLKEMLKDCLESLEEVQDEVNFEVIIPDNGSTDGSLEMLQELKTQNSKLKTIDIGRNLGFAKGNNQARKYCRGEYVLFLNADTVVYKNTLKKSVEYLDKHKDVGAVTCKMLLANGNLDKDTRRSFITPWIGLVHIFLKLDRLFPKSRLFGQYWYGYISENKIHEVDVIEGAYFLTRKTILDEVDWFDESYYLDGENVELCWQIKERGWKIVYFPKAKITHYKGAAKGKIDSHTRKQVPLEERLKFRMAGVNSMEKFYRRHFWSKYPLPFSLFVLTGIKVVKTARFIRTILLG